MNEKHNDSLHSWSSRMLSGIDVVCRCKVPFVPELNDQPKWEHLSSSFDYDFVQERQAVADYLQYWEQRSRLEFSTSAQETNSLAHPSRSNSPSHLALTLSEPQRSSCSPIFNCVEQLLPHDRTHRLSPGPIPARMVWSISKLPPLPVAARHLVSDQVLQPKKAACTTPLFPYGSEERVQTTSIPGHSAHTIVSSPTNAEQLSYSGLYLPDFDSGPDDPFTSVELRTINELEELRNVLVPPPVTKSPPSITPQNHASLAHSDHTNQISIQPDITASLRGSISTHDSSKTDTVGATASPSHPTPSNPPDTIARSPSVKTIDRFHSIENGFSVLPHRSLSSSVPNLEVTSASTRPDSRMSPFASVCPRYRTLASKPNTTQPTAGFADTCNRMPDHPRPDLPLPGPTNPHFQALITWASHNRLSVPRVMQLLQLDRNGLNLLDLPLEQAKRTLADQLRLTDLLMSEFNQPHHPLSERSALLAASAFTYDMTKARQFASLTLDLERSGYSQEVSQSYLLNPSHDPGTALSLMLSTLPSLKAVSPLATVTRSSTSSRVANADHMASSQMN